MLLTPLPVIVRSFASCPPPSFDWGDEEDADGAVGEIDEDYVEEFKTINSMAAFAYVLAAVEWMYWYVYEGLDPEDAKDYNEYLAAHWVWICDLPRKVPPPPYEMRDDSDPPNPVFDGAVFSALESVANGIYSLPHHETAIDAAYVTQLCEYVFPDECGFRQWRSAVIQRLRREFPADAEHYSRVQISRRLFDTDAEGPISHEADCAASVAMAESGSHNRYLPLRPPT